MILLAEATAALAVVAAGGNAFAAALTYLLVRLAGSLVLSFVLGRIAPWLGGVTRRAPLAELRPLVRPALAALAIPGGYAVMMQGSVAAIGSVAGAAAVPAFAVVRTLTRSVLQFAMRLNLASMPRYTTARARGDRAWAARLVAVNLLAMVAMLVPAALAMVWLGEAVVAVWTARVVHPSETMILLMVLAMVFDGIWASVSNLLLAINRQSTFAYMFLVLSGVFIALGAWLTGRFGAEGMAGAVMALEAAMAAWVLRVAVRERVIVGGELREAWRSGLGWLRGVAGRG